MIINFQLQQQEQQLKLNEIIMKREPNDPTNEKKEIIITFKNNTYIRLNYGGVVIIIVIYLIKRKIFFCNEKIYHN